MKPEEFQMLAGNLENTTPQSNEKKIISVARVIAPITAYKRFILFAVLVSIISLTQQAMAAAEDIVAGAFDAATGVPFASKMLAVVRSGEQTSQSPEVLDSRLSAVEAMLKDMDSRLRLVESRLKQLQNEVVKISNINRLRELQRIRAELAEINAELKTKPTDPGRRSILEFRARQQADVIKNNVDFDIWKMSDITPGDQTVRTRFFVYPSFELYAIAITTWFAAIEMNSGHQTQRIVNESGSFLLDHAAFLQTRSTWRELLDEPLTLEEHLRTAAFCRLEAITKFSDARGDCFFATVCVDEMASKSEETDRQTTLAMQPSKAGILCTFNPGQAQGLKGEDKLRASYGAELMAALAKNLDQLAHTGSLREPFVGTFPNFINAQIFSVPLDGPVLAPLGAASGTFPAIPKCTLVVGGCSFGVKLSEQTTWKITNTKNSDLIIRHNGSGLCLDVKNSVAVSGASVILFSCNDTVSQIWNKHNNGQFTLESNKSGMCVTVEPAADPKKELQLRRSLLLQKCDQRELQKFSHSDSPVVGPN